MDLLDRARDKLIFIGIGLGAVFWLIESLMHYYVFHPFDFFVSVFSPGAHEAWMRLIIVSMFISFGIYAQWLMPGRKRAQEALSHANSELSQIFETSNRGQPYIQSQDFFEWLEQPKY